ncbi:MAG: hypothetical protein Q7S28_00005, partial [bacterium]|nr:hypothetical protein [bacterium]
TEIDHLAARLREIGLPALKEEGMVLHIHQHLDIFLNGEHFDVPAGAGINQKDGFISTLHTHDTRGVIHIESPTAATFTLGQFFDVWGVRLTNDCIGGYCNEGENVLKMFVNGTQYNGNPRDLALEPHQEIVVAYGTDAELPDPIPSSYTFQGGE